MNLSRRFTPIHVRAVASLSVQSLSCLRSAPPASGGRPFYGETCSYAYPLRFLFRGSPVSVSSPFPGVEERGRAVPSAVAFGAALSVGAVRAGVRRARGISDGSENRPPDSYEIFYSTSRTRRTEHP